MSGVTHDPVTQVISVEPILPAEPVVIANSGFLTTLAQVEREIAHLKITDAPTAQAAANLLTRLTSAGSKLETARKTVKEPFLLKCREIDDAAKAPAARIETAKTALKKMQTEWALEQARIAAEAERKRQAEIARLEALRKEEERKEQERLKEIERLAAEAAKANAVPVVDVDFGDSEPPEPAPKTETQKAIETLQHAPVPVAAAPAGVSIRKRLIIASIDVAKLPDAFVIRTANEREIRRVYCEGWKDGDPMPEVSGVAFKVDTIVASTGRAVF